MQYLTINGYQVPYSNDLQLQKVPNIVNEMTTLTGKVVADINGWKYADVTLTWGTLLDQDLQNLLTAISANAFLIEFTDIDGSTHSINAILKGRANIKTPLFHNGQTVWRDVSISLSFPDCYEDE